MFWAHSLFKLVLPSRFKLGYFVRKHRSGGAEYSYLYASKKIGGYTAEKRLGPIKIKPLNSKYHGRHPKQLVSRTRKRFPNAVKKLRL